MTTHFAVATDTQPPQLRPGRHQPADVNILTLEGSRQGQLQPQRCTADRRRLIRATVCRLALKQLGKLMQVCLRGFLEAAASRAAAAKGPARCCCVLRPATPQAAATPGRAAGSVPARCCVSRPAAPQAAALWPIRAAAAAAACLCRAVRLLCLCTPSQHRGGTYRHRHSLAPAAGCTAAVASLTPAAAAAAVAVLLAAAPDVAGGGMALVRSRPETRRGLVPAVAGSARGLCFASGGCSRPGTCCQERLDSSMTILPGCNVQGCVAAAVCECCC